MVSKSAEQILGPIRQSADHFSTWRICKHCSEDSLACEGIGAAYRGEGDVGNNDGVHGAGGSAEGLVLVAVGVVLVLVDLAIGLSVPGHGRLADADVALGSDGGGLAAEVPGITNTAD